MYWGKSYEVFGSTPMLPHSYCLLYHHSQPVKSRPLPLFLFTLPHIFDCLGWPRCRRASCLAPIRQSTHASLRSPPTTWVALPSHQQSPAPSWLWGTLRELRCSVGSHAIDLSVAVTSVWNSVIQSLSRKSSHRLVLHLSTLCCQSMLNDCLFDLRCT